MHNLVNCGGQLSRPSGYNLPLIGHPNSLQKDNSYGLATPPNVFSGKFFAKSWEKLRNA